MKQIQSRDNAHYKALCRLAANARTRRQLGQTLLDGAHLTQALTASGMVAQEFIVSVAGAINPEIAACLAAQPAVAVTVLSDALFAALSPVDAPSGLLTRIAIPSPAALRLSADTLLVDDVQDPGNLGGLLRTAAAAGIRQALLSPATTQAWSPRALRAGMGAQLAMSIHEDADLPAFLGQFGGRCMVTALGASTALFDADLVSAPLAWVFGNEGAGVGPTLLALADARLEIPMPGGIESLNVAAAAAVCLFEMVRQRRAVRG